MKKLVYRTTTTRIRYILQGKIQLLIQKRQILKKNSQNFFFSFYFFTITILNLTTLKKTVKKYFLKMFSLLIIILED